MISRHGNYVLYSFLSGHCSISPNLAINFYISSNRHEETNTATYKCVIKNNFQVNKKRINNNNKYNVRHVTRVVDFLYQVNPCRAIDWLVWCPVS